MIERFLRALVWGCAGATIGFLLVGLIIIKINSIYARYDPRDDEASENIGYAVGFPLGFTFGAMHGLREQMRKELSSTV